MILFLLMMMELDIRNLEKDNIYKYDKYNNLKFVK